MPRQGPYGTMDGRVRNLWSAMILWKGHQHEPDRIWRSIPALDNLCITSRQQLIVQLNATMIDGEPVKDNYLIRIMKTPVNPYNIDVMYLHDNVA